MNDQLQTEIKRLISEANSEEAQEGLRSELFDRYMGEPYGDEVAGRSKFVDTTVSDACEAVLTDILDVFTSQKRLVVFDPVGPEDEDAAEQETDVCHHIFWQKNAGFENLYTWIKEAIVQQNAYCWSGWVEKRRVTIEEYEGLDLDELAYIVSQLEGEYDFLEQSGFEMIEGEAVQMLDPETGEPEPIAVKLRCVKKSKEYVIEPFPQEEFFCTPRWGRVSLDDIPCHGRKQEKRRSELLAMGFQEASIDDALSHDDEFQKESRHDTQDSSEYAAEGAETVTLYEAYLILEKDGEEGLYKAYCSDEAGNLLKWANGDDALEEVSRGQISCLTPMIIPHRHIGRSISERVDDIQQVNTVLMRHTLDNLYGTNHARPYFDENGAGEYTYTDLQNPAHGAPVRTGGADIQWHTPPSVIGTTLPVLEKMSALKEERTGATRYNQGLDAESLNKTVGGMGMILNASQKKNKLVARTFAETGIRDLFLRMHADLRAGPIKELAMKLNNQWVSVNPQTWKERTDMTAAVGMGKGDQDIQRQGHMHLGQVQRELIGQSPMVGEQEVYNNVKDAAATFGIEQVDRYVKDPSTIPPMPPQPEPPNPILISAEIEQAKIQSDAQVAMQKAAMDHEYRMAQLQIQDAELANKIQTDDEKLELERGKAVMADDLARDQMANTNTPTDELAQN